MRLDPDGAQLFPRAFAPDGLARLLACLDSVPNNRPGSRLRPLEGLEDAAAPAGRLAASILGPAARPVRAVLFDKSAGRNWALGWHQDRTIAVRERREVSGFADWTRKSGIVHVVPPFDYLERMLTLRIHLDRVDPDNAPLLVVPGSHRLGRIGEPAVPEIIQRLGARSCEAAAGDVWLYATPILHASRAAARPRRRRVLQLLYSADELPGGLEWLGV